MKININDGSDHYLITGKTYRKLTNFIGDFENSTDDDTDPAWMSDGEWLDVAFDLLKKIYTEASL